MLSGERLKAVDLILAYVCQATNVNPSRKSITHPML
jgi:hypothetical protein